MHDSRRMQQQQPLRRAAPSCRMSPAAKNVPGMPSELVASCNRRGPGMRLGEGLTHDVNRAAGADNVSSSERLLQVERNVSGRVQLGDGADCRGRETIYCVETRPQAKTWRNSETRRRESWAYQSAVGMLSSDGCTQSNGSREMQRVQLIMAWCWVEGAKLEGKSWAASSCWRKGVCAGIGEQRRRNGR
jgi:hypothetical protein